MIRCVQKRMFQWKWVLLGIMLVVLTGIGCQESQRQEGESSFAVMAYYAGPPDKVDSFDLMKVTHIIFSFGHLKGNALHIGFADDSMTIQKMVAWKSRNPDLKVMLSLGGWGGCETCSDVFNTEAGRKEFAESVKSLSAYFKTDGLDLDWEYPVIPGYPNHPYREDDRDNFTALCRELHEVNGDDFILSFAAGGSVSFLEKSIDWKGVTPYVDYMNLMTYDLVHGNSSVSGHHTPLYSTPQQTESTDHAVQYILRQGVPASKLVIGAAFYGRYFLIEEKNPVDLYQPCRFVYGFSYRHQTDSLARFEVRWDSIAQAPYGIDTTRRLLATYDDPASIRLKVAYAHEHQLGGIMFWQLVDDKYRGGLLDEIVRE